MQPLRDDRGRHENTGRDDAAHDNERRVEGV
jgi:hypothetical protein